MYVCVNVRVCVVCCVLCVVCVCVCVCACVCVWVGLFVCLGSGDSGADRTHIYVERSYSI